MILDMYLHGLSTGDFSKFLDKILGEEASLSSITITRLKESWHLEYEEWRQRPLEESYLTFGQMESIPRPVHQTKRWHY
ncbi:MAG: hypothetical protein FJ213_02660 [Ignavibacteria bacterium]|nr:hypothetical protein [Ignavibacteria bacterium]